MQFLAEHFSWGLEDFNQMTWRMRKELIGFHIETLEERRKQHGK